MKLSPLDIYNKDFKKATFGYNTDQVEAFLDEVGMAYEKLLKEVTVLQDENDRLSKRLDSYQEMEERLEKMLNTVQNSAKDYTRQARKEAELIIKNAEMKAEQLKKEALRGLEQEYRRLQKLKENKNLFKIRFKTLLQSHLQMLEESGSQGEEDDNRKDNEGFSQQEEEQGNFAVDNESFRYFAEDAAASSEDEALDE